MADVWGWWFCTSDEDGVVRLPHGDGRVVRVGETLTVDGPIVPCERGLHASRQVLDALEYAPYAPASWLARVRCHGTVVEDFDKLAASARTTVWLADVSRVLHTFACDVAEDALRREHAAGRELDSHFWEALQVKRAWIAGTATDAERHAAESAAWRIAYLRRNMAPSAQDAAWSAAWSINASAKYAVLRAVTHALSVPGTTYCAQEEHLVTLLRAAGAPIEEEA